MYLWMPMQIRIWVDCISWHILKFWPTKMHLLFFNLSNHLYTRLSAIEMIFCILRDIKLHWNKFFNYQTKYAIIQYTSNQCRKLKNRNIEVYNRIAQLCKVHILYCMEIELQILPFAMFDMCSDMFNKIVFFSFFFSSLHQDYYPYFSLRKFSWKLFSWRQWR